MMGGMVRAFLFLLPLLGTLWVAAAASARAEPLPHLTMAWRDKPPYHYLEQGLEKGFLLARARAVMQTVGAEVQFVREPSKRIWANFQSGISNYCSFGWYRLAEREAIAHYSIPFHVDPPHIVVIAPGAAQAVARHDSLASLLADRRLVFGVVDGVSYGAALDKAIAASANQVVRRTVEPMAMARMLAAGRVDFMLMDREDWAYFQERDLSLKGVGRRDLKDMPAGLERYIVCSRETPPEFMARINKAIEQALQTDSRRLGQKRR